VAATVLPARSRNPTGGHNFDHYNDHNRLADPQKLDIIQDNPNCYKALEVHSTTDQGKNIYFGAPGKCTNWCNMFLINEHEHEHQCYVINKKFSANRKLMSISVEIHL